MKRSTRPFLVSLAFACFCAPQALTAQGGDGTPGAYAAVEAAIESAYRRCLRTYTVSGTAISVRMPFAQEAWTPERAGEALTVAGGGKGDPARLWQIADAALSTSDFARFVSVLESGTETVLSFDPASRTWEAEESGLSSGRADRRSIIAGGRPIIGADLSDYLSSVARIGLDCSGFVWSVLTSIGRAGGMDLERTLRGHIGTRSAAAVRLYVNGGFFDPRNDHVEEVDDEVRNLRPGDVIVFRAPHGGIVHSAVIQSVDLARGRIRYVQCTDLAPREERGVHESLISFDPSTPDLSLKDVGVSWHQRMERPFVGEPDVRYRDDGERYRGHGSPEGGTVVRLKALERAMERLRSPRPD